ncbi:hypothetical protein K461DRAFT_278392 [Myriangium duriaei CBS 260.36]|uniref:DUF4185 domain-containing protein n=1 Tax=Myriangium duriaei CBS 260.36 TaxID=1168546 RepID=A0A9P4MHV4_9PEZI|nr:hypothetical protein K461DRAFT_278392 [Myriangium duriaei CBS 260.36]
MQFHNDRTYGTHNGRPPPIPYESKPPFTPSSSLFPASEKTQSIRFYKRKSFVLIMLFTAICAIVIPVAVVYGKPVHKATTAITLPNPTEFNKQNGTKWTIAYQGDLKFTGVLGAKNLYGDKCRSSFLGGRHLWNCGDMQCAAGYSACSFSMGASFYGTDKVDTINSSAYPDVYSYTFAQPWKGDPKPVAPQSQYGMDTSNIVPINETTGLAYAYEVTRGDPSVPVINKGNAVLKVTLGPNNPVATRMGPLLTGNDTVSLGLLSIMREGDYIYNYNVDGGAGNVMVGRVKASDAAFDRTQYEYLTYASSNTSKPVWKKGIPTIAGASAFGMTTAEANGRFACQHYGDVYFNNYFERYMLLCNCFNDYTLFYLASNPWGPWSQGYLLLMPPNRLGYGVNAHPSYSPGGNHKTMYFSQGPNTVFNLYKVEFNY